MRVAYVRVSTIEQNESRQIEALEKYNIEKWFTEKVSGKDTNRPKLKEMLEFVRERRYNLYSRFQQIIKKHKRLIGIDWDFKSKESISCK